MIELKPIYDSRKSFYGKAKIDIKDDEISKSYLLYSYGTLVAIYTYDKITGLKRYDYLGRYSQTTTRHQKEFFQQYGYDLSDKEIKELFKNGFLEIKER